MGVSLAVPGRTLAQIYCRGLEQRLKECTRLLEEAKRDLEEARRLVEEAEEKLVKAILLRLDLEEVKHDNGQRGGC